MGSYWPSQPLCDEGRLKTLCLELSRRDMCQKGMVREKSSKEDYLVGISHEKDGPSLITTGYLAC